MQFADFHPGQVIEFGSYTLSEQELVEFARRYDAQYFHTDAVAARDSRWGGLIASGFHTCSIAMSMVATNVLQGSTSIGSPGLEYVKWFKPVRAGDTLRMRCTIASAKPSSTGKVGVLLWTWVVLNQNDEPVMELSTTSLFGL